MPRNSKTGMERLENALSHTVRCYQTWKLLNAQSPNSFILKGHWHEHGDIFLCVPYPYRALRGAHKLLKKCPKRHLKWQKCCFQICKTPTGHTIWHFSRFQWCFGQFFGSFQAHLSVQERCGIHGKISPLETPYSMDGSVSKVFCPFLVTFRVLFWKFPGPLKFFRGVWDP